MELVVRMGVQEMEPYKIILIEFEKKAFHFSLILKMQTRKTFILNTAIFEKLFYCGL